MEWGRRQKQKIETNMKRKRTKCFHPIVCGLPTEILQQARIQASLMSNRFRSNVGIGCEKNSSFYYPCFASFFALSSCNQFRIFIMHQRNTISISNQKLYKSIHKSDPGQLRRYPGLHVTILCTLWRILATGWQFGMFLVSLKKKVVATTGASTFHTSFDICHVV